MTCQWYGATPPVAGILPEYWLPASPVGSPPGTAVNWALSTVRVKVTGAAGGSTWSVTSTAKVKDPVAVGSPEITPLVAERLNPGGNAPEDTDHW
jgi:hypothetical protein